MVDQTSLVGKSIQVKMHSFSEQNIEKAMKDIVVALRSSGSNIYGPIPLPMKPKKFIVNTSPHVNKNAREQLEIRRHSRMIIISNTDPGVLQEISNIKISYGIEVDFKFVEA
jgi:small subunit ribosomal protein S10